jgi:hypothetical protein
LRTLITPQQAIGQILDYTTPSLDTTILAITNAIWLFALPLARLEMRAILTALAARVSRFEIVETRRLLNNTLRGLESRSFACNDSQRSMTTRPLGENTIVAVVSLNPSGVIL